MSSVPLLPSEEGDASITRGASLQSGAVGRHHARVSSLASLSNTNLKWTTGDVASIELHINQIEAVLPRNEPDCILVCRSEREMESRVKNSLPHEQEEVRSPECYLGQFQ